MTITVPASGFIDIKLFEKMLDISKVVYYSLEDKGGYLSLKFYDSKKKVVKPYAFKKEKTRSKKKQTK